MAFDNLKAFFIEQSLNRAFPTNLPGAPASSDTSSVVREAILDDSVAVDAEILPSAPMKIMATSDELVRVAPCTKDDTMYGIVLYKTKNYINTKGRNRFVTVARDMKQVFVACKTAINAGAAIYYDPTDGLYTSSNSNTVKVGMALDTITTAVATGKVIRIEVQCARV